MKAVLVLGGSGFIGSAVIRELCRNYKVYALVHRFNINVSSPNLIEIRTNIDKLETQEFPEQIVYLFDFAWFGTSGIERSDLTIQISNILDRVKIIELCSRLGCKYIGAGSIMETESVKNVFTKNSKLKTDSYYSHAKYFAHAVSKAKAMELGVEYVWGRITSTYGPGEKSQRLIYSTIRKICEGDVPNFSKCDQLYDFIYIDDLAKAFVLIAEYGKNGSDYILGSGEPKPLINYLNCINQLLLPDKSFQYGIKADVCKYLTEEEYSTARLVEDTGFMPQITFDEGIINTYHWYLKKSD